MTPARHAADALRLLLTVEPANAFAQAELACLHRELGAFAVGLVTLVTQRRICDHRLTAVTNRLAKGISGAIAEKS